MANYLYGLILARNADRLRPAIAGFERVPIRVARCDALGALVSAVSARPTRDDMANLRTHDGALRAVVNERVTVAASRFGQTFAGDEELCGHLHPLGERITALLERLDGCVEMRLLVRQSAVPKEREPAASVDAATLSPGRAYLEARRSEAQRATRVGVRAVFGALVQEENVETIPGGVAYAHVVRFEDQQAYRDRAAAEAAFADARIVGPLPLYSAVDPENG